MRNVFLLYFKWNMYRRSVFCACAGKAVVVRKVIRNGQPEEADKKDSKASETKNQKSNESVDADGEKKEKPKLKPSIKPKVGFLALHRSRDSHLSETNNQFIIAG